MESIRYKEGYKYQIVDASVTDISIKPEQDIQSDYIDLTSEGELTIKKGYAWDGPSGPTVDTLNFMRGSLVHDALYQLMREKHLEKARYRKPADKEMRKICREDGMNPIRALVVYLGVRIGGGPSADPANKKKVVTAPKA